MAAAAGVESLAFPGISTGIFGYPTEDAALVPVRTVRQGLAAGCPVQSVTFGCFSAADLAVYQAVLA